jgi:hypothetical protein
MWAVSLVKWRLLANVNQHAESRYDDSAFFDID